MSRSYLVVFLRAWSFELLSFSINTVRYSFRLLQYNLSIVNNSLRSYTLSSFINPFSATQRELPVTMVRSTAITLAATFFATLAAAATIDKRIVGGEDVPDGEIKFIVSLRDENGTHVCGGSLLDSTTVLTAAHCLISDEIQIVSVTAGTVVNILPTLQSSTLVQLMEYEAAQS